MDIKSEYEKLYQQWLDEFKQIELTPLNTNTYAEYKKAWDYLNKYKLDQDDQIKLNIVNCYRENFNYLFNDFAKIREIKLINTALALKEIDFNNVLEAEKLFYQNLISTIKGFEKVKTIETSQSAGFNTIDEKNVAKLIDSEEPLQPKPNLKIENSLDFSSNKEIDEEEFNYTLVRFLQKTPPLVGIDLINYGPFEKQNIANLPYKNAKILLEEKIVELIELI